MAIINLIKGDNMDWMKTTPEKYYQLSIVDPPYGINQPNMQMGSHPNRTGIGQGGGISTTVKLKGRLNTGSGKLKNRILKYSKFDWDNEIPSEQYFSELKRVSVNQIIFGGNYFPLPPTRGIVFWDKLQPWENFSQFELIWTSFDCPAYKIAISTTGGNNKEQKIHPTQKPVELYKKILNKYAKKGDKILDTNGGSMSLAIACYDLGFDLDIIEMNEDYYNDGKARYMAHVAKYAPVSEIQTNNEGQIKLF